MLRTNDISRHLGLRWISDEYRICCNSPQFLAKPPSWKIETYLPYLDDCITVDDVAIPGTRATTTIVLTYLSQYATGSAVEGLIIYIKVLSLLAPLTNVSWAARFGTWRIPEPEVCLSVELCVNFTCFIDSVRHFRTISDQIWSSGSMHHYLKHNWRGFYKYDVESIWIASISPRSLQRWFPYASSLNQCCGAQ